MKTFVAKLSSFVAITCLFAGAAQAADAPVYAANFNPAQWAEYVPQAYPDGMEMLDAYAVRSAERLGTDGKTVVSTKICARHDLADSKGEQVCATFAGKDERFVLTSKVRIARVAVMDFKGRTSMRTYMEPADVGGVGYVVDHTPAHKGPAYLQEQSLLAAAAECQRSLAADGLSHTGAEVLDCINAKSAVETN